MSDGRNGPLMGGRFSLAMTGGEQRTSSPISSFSHGLTRQIKRSRRAQAVRDRQRILLLQVIVETMLEFDISDEDIRSIYRACAVAHENEDEGNDDPATS
ncbi:hypothetical protein GCM10007205_00950 [Oxalicibacterium flavum]|uniref:Uncharacterized protein n=1 Tax=Oxalicibacterium flavum TaxID=179467 RepID=A0A8J2XY85_9BURK|nr:hypothetical protein [Oxalicibacterium flavum]GGB95536.1 hypothetical protein GCM10007205_00950 [Oxalicibacterium flavum]